MAGLTACHFGIANTQKGAQMATYTYDDGSTISNDETPSGWTTTSTAATDNGIYGYAADQREAEKLNQFYGTGTGGSTGGEWWEKLAIFGATRAIDSHFGPTATDKTAAPATFAGQNGLTYRTGTATTGTSGDSGGGVLLLIAAGAAALMLM